MMTGLLWLLAGVVIGWVARSAFVRASKFPTDEDFTQPHWLGPGHPKPVRRFPGYPGTPPNQGGGGHK